jgi:hypothetical protein
MKRFFNLSTIITTAVLVAGTVFFLWVGSYAAAIMALLALYWACMARRSELMAADGLEIIGDLISHRDKLLAENKAAEEKVNNLLASMRETEAALKEKGKAPVDSPEPQPVQTAKPQTRKRPKSKRPIQDIKESLKEISPKKEGE